MNFQDRRVKILVGLCVLLCLVVGYRIFDNIQKNKERAARINKGREVAVETALPKRVTIVPEMIFSGSLDPEWQAEVAPKVDGRIEKVFVKEGDRVTKGQVLATLEQVDIDAEVLKARSEYVEAKTNLRKAARDLERYEKLYQAGAVSEQTVDDYRFAHENADAQLNAALGNLRGKESSLSGTNIVAPADGIIAKRYFQEGYYAKSGNVLFAIADISTLKTVINIPEGQIAGVAVGNEAKITLPAFENREIIGKITSIAVNYKDWYESFKQNSVDYVTKVQKEKEAENEILEAVQQMEESFEKELGQMRTEWEKINKDTEEAYINAAKKVETQFGEEIDQMRTTWQKLNKDSGEDR